MTPLECFNVLTKKAIENFLQDYLARNPSLPHSLFLSGFTVELQMRDLHLSCILMLDYLSYVFTNLDYANGVFAKFADDMAAKISEDIPHPIKMTWDRPQGGFEFSPIIEFRLDTPLQ